MSYIWFCEMQVSTPGLPRVTLKHKMWSQATVTVGQIEVIRRSAYNLTAMIDTKI